MQNKSNTDAPLANPSPLPTPGDFSLTGRGKSVEGVMIIGHPVGHVELTHALHLAEVITYRDGTHDIVGYFPEGNGQLHAGDPLYVETTFEGQTKAQYIAEGLSHYRLDVHATAHQSLDQLVANQERAWAAFDRSKHPPAYDFQVHNSNSAMVGSFRDAGRGDVSDELVRELEPKSVMQTLEQGLEHLSPAAASMRVAQEKLSRGRPYAPGASQELSHIEVEGRVIAAPPRIGSGTDKDELAAIFDAGRSAIADLRGGDGVRNLLDAAPARDGSSFTVMLTEAHGVSTLHRRHEPFEQAGSIISADKLRVVQDIGHGETLTYRTDDLLHSAHDKAAALEALEHAASTGRPVRIDLNAVGIQVSKLDLAAPRLADTDQTSHRTSNQSAKLTMFDDGPRDVTPGYRVSGVVSTIGPLIGITEHHSTGDKVTLFKKAELLACVSVAERPSLSSMLHDGKKISIESHEHGVTVSASESPGQQMLHVRARSVERSSLGRSVGD